MKTNSKSDIISLLLGSLIILLIAWKVIEYILPDQMVYTDGHALLQDVTKAHGGIENWNKNKSLIFTKEFKLYEEDGSISIDQIEVHNYTMSRSPISTIQWKQEKYDFLLKKDQDSIYQLIGSSLDTTQTSEELTSMLNASQFVINLPFSLKDKNAHLTYEGDTVFEDQLCHVLKANFKNSNDSWFFYFTVNDLSWLGYWVATSDHYSLIINEEMTEVNGFTLSRKRKSYRTDKNQKILYLRATYFYSNYTID